MFLQHKTRYKPPSEFITFMLFSKLNLFWCFPAWYCHQHNQNMIDSVVKIIDVHSSNR